MQLRATVLSAATLSVAMLAGCAGGTQGTNPVMPGSGMTQNQVRPDRFDPARSGIAPNFLGTLHLQPIREGAAA